MSEKCKFFLFLFSSFKKVQSFWLQNHRLIISARILKAGYVRHEFLFENCFISTAKQMHVYLACCMHRLSSKIKALLNRAKIKAFFTACCSCSCFSGTKETTASAVVVLFINNTCTYAWYNRGVLFKEKVFC